MATVQPGQKKGIELKKVILVILVLFILMLITTSIAYVVARYASSEGRPKAVELQNKYITYPAGDFLTNLSDRGYIKVSLVYLLSDKEVEKEIKSKDYEIRDRIFSILRSKNFDGVKDSKGMEELRKQIKESINAILSSGEVEDVFFTSIIVN
ncbi:flagellar basal body-associated FliL family protein [Thermoanaerobacterium sp. DL9XJH110]|jgi:flagellar FliL protein|uniref:flagellar basal body-associated FliL family protein n=1 Tax=Thermoanaerobacterium sp. DL9XJH110 TaxID=3386643 RepID=UPI003BB5BE99